MNLIALDNIPLVKPGDDISQIIINSVRESRLYLENGDIFVVAQKIISKAENRLFNLSQVEPSELALKIAVEVDKDPRFIELVLSESSEILRKKSGTIIVEHKLGFVCANAGIDHSNVDALWGNPDDWVLLLPVDPDYSASSIRCKIKAEFGAEVGVLIIDSHGRAWRQGIVGMAIGISGLPGLVDMRGKPDLFGYKLRITQIAVADELAAAASLLMGQAAEGSPVVHVRGFPYPLRDGTLAELIRPKELDLFR